MAKSNNIPPICIAHISNANDFLINAQLQGEAIYQQFFSFMKSETRSKNTTRILGKRKNTMLEASYSENINNLTEIKSARLAAKAAKMKTASVLSMPLNQKLRRPTNFDNTVTLNKRSSDASLSPLHASKYQRLNDELPVGSSNNERGIGSEDVELNGKNRNTISSRRTTRANAISKQTTGNNEIDFLIPSYIGKESETYKQLLASRVVMSNQEVTSTTDSGISETENCNSLDKKRNDENVRNNCDNEISNDAEVTKPNTRTKVLKSSKNKNEQANEVGNETNKRNQQVDDSICSQVDELANTRPRRNIKKKNYTFCEEPLAKNESQSVIEITEESKRTKVISKQKTQLGDDETDKVEADVEPTTSKYRTKVISKPVEEDIFAENNDTETTKVNKRTKVISKPKTRLDDKVNDQEETDNEPVTSKCRTKVISKPEVEDIFAENNDAEEEGDINSKQEKSDKNTTRVVASDTSNKEKSKNNGKTVQNVIASPKCESVVKKRVEEFEKINFILTAPSTENGGRVTRTKTRALAAVAAVTEDEDEVQEITQAKDDTQECGKENVMSANQQKKKDKVRATPLANNNRIFSPRSANELSTKPPQNNKAVVKIIKTPSQNSITKKKEDEILYKNKKIDEATKKKEKTLRATADETRRKREEKCSKVAAARELAEKEKAALALKHEKEKEEKNRLILLEKEKMKEEYEKRKLLNQQKLQEAEERRKLEEAARLAKLKEQEEEHKRIQAIKEKEQENAERMKQEGLKKKMEKTAKKNNLKSKLNPASAKPKTATKPASSTYDMTPHRDERPLMKPKTENDYGIDDAQTDDSSEDESRPKKQIPIWAQVKIRLEHLEAQEITNRGKFFGIDSDIDLKILFSKTQLPQRMRPRTSSAVWTTPPC